MTCYEALHRLLPATHQPFGSSKTPAMARERYSIPPFFNVLAPKT